MPPSPPSPVPNPTTTTPTHWLHKSGIQILSDYNATNPPTPDSNGLKPTSINVHLYIKYRPSIYAIQNNDGVITVPWSWIDPNEWPEAAESPLSELILDWLTPGIRTASIEAPQFLEFRFDEPLVESVDVYASGEEKEKGDEGKQDDGGENGGQKRKRDEEEEAGDEGIGSDDSDGEETDDSDSDESTSKSGDESDDESEEDGNDDHAKEDDNDGDGKEDENESVRDASKEKTVKAKPVEKVLLLAVIMSVNAANRDWVMPGFKKRAWFRDTNPWVLQQILGGQVVERLKQIGAERGKSISTCYDGRRVANRVSCSLR